MSSGFFTGANILTDTEYLITPYFSWSFRPLIDNGVSAPAIMNNSKMVTMVMRAEVPGPVFGKKSLPARASSYFLHHLSDYVC